MCTVNYNACMMYEWINRNATKLYSRLKKKKSKIQNE